MIYLKENPVGIDYEINKLQKYIHNKTESWNIESFGRTELVDNKLLIFESDSDYSEVIALNENFNGRFFFVDSNVTTEKAKELKTEVSIVFILDISRIKSDIPHRADEEVKIELLNIIRKKTRSEISILKGEEVLISYESDLKDLQPYHFLKFSFELNYNNNVSVF